MSKEYEFISTEDDVRDEMDYEEVRNAVFGAGTYEYEIKEIYKKLRKKFKKHYKSQAPKTKKIKKKLSKLEDDLKKMKKEQQKSKLAELINCDNAAKRKQLARDIFGEDGVI